MANRAYLYFNGSAEPHKLVRWKHDEYFDSRHNVPFFWPLFFRPDDLVRVPIASSIENEDHNNVRLVAQWPTCRDLFARRARLVLPLLRGCVTEKELLLFEATLARYSIRFETPFLVLDPFEIDGCDEEAEWNGLLQKIETGDTAETFTNLNLFSGMMSELHAADPFLGYFGTFYV